MPVEPGLVAANILVYAMDADSPQHAASRALIESARDESANLYTTAQIICEYSIVTNARRVAKPRSADEAFSAISSLVDILQTLPVPVSTVETLLGLIRRHPVTGGDIFDLQIVATMIANGVFRVYTFNVEDFKIFSELEVLRP
jgi:predicted nucleic acid-binding protein